MGAVQEQRLPCAMLVGMLQSRRDNDDDHDCFEEQAAMNPPIFLS